MELLLFYLAFSFFIAYGVISAFRTVIVIVFGTITLRGYSIPTVPWFVTLHLIWAICIGYMVYCYNMGII